MKASDLIAIRGFLIFVVFVWLSLCIVSCDDDDDDNDTTDGFSISEVATGLDTPWEIAFAPDGRIFFTERIGQVRVIESGRLKEDHG